MLLLEFVQEHRSEQVVVDGEGLARFVVLHEVGVDMGDLFGDQTVLEGMGSLLCGVFVAKCDRSQAHQLIAHAAHILDVVLEASGGPQGTQLAQPVDEYLDPAPCGSAIDPGDVGRRLGTGGADANNAAISRQAGIPDGDIVAAGSYVLSCTVSQCDIVVTRGVGEEGVVPLGCVTVTRGVILKGIGSIGGVDVPCSIVSEGIETVGRVVETRSV